MSGHWWNHPAAVAAGLMAACLAVISVPARADAVEEVQTAIRHAQLAAGSESTGGVHRHLQHVINCLEGNGGEHFDVDAGHPCEGQGQGALNDIPGMLHRYQALVAQARDLAVIGAGIEYLSPARHAATAVSELLVESQEM